MRSDCRKVSHVLKERFGELPGHMSGYLEELDDSGVGCSSSSPQIEGMYYKGLFGLLQNIRKLPGHDEAVLCEGSDYPGCWLESTGTINAERLSQFCPSATSATFRLFADMQRLDGLIPFAVTEWQTDNYSHLQIASPLARSVWNHYRLHGDRVLLARMYHVMASYDSWVARHRNTLGTGCVEAFCVWDTGHDLSPRFWHCPDSPHVDAMTCPESPLLPYAAPDMTANIYAQRKYLSLIAAELGLPDSEVWMSKAADTMTALERTCFCASDIAYYDMDRHGRHVRLLSDILLRVAECEAVSGERFADLLRHHLLNTRRFFARYPLTSIAMDDGRFSQEFRDNSWAGPTNLLSLLRAPHAFEFYGHHVELTWLIAPTLFALAREGKFPQTLDPWTGRAGYASSYTPAMLCYLDFIERLCGISVQPDGTIWFTGLSPMRYEGHGEFGGQMKYHRRVGDRWFGSSVGEASMTIEVDGKTTYIAPKGVRIVTDGEGNLKAIIGMSVARVRGTLRHPYGSYDFEIGGNDSIVATSTGFLYEQGPGVVLPS